LADEDSRCGPAMGKIELDNGDDDDVDDEDDEDDEDDDDEDDEDMIDDDESMRGDGAGDGNVNGDSSSARVPEPSRYSFPRHLIVDEPVKALK
jgi:hypothetical protein